MTIRCPNCLSEEFYYVEDVTNYWTIEAICNNNVDLGDIDSETTCEGTQRLQCEECGFEDYSINQAI